jgi:hypothetical protein
LAGIKCGKKESQCLLIYYTNAGIVEKGIVGIENYVQSTRAAFALWLSKA